MIDYAVIHIRAKKWAEKQFTDYYGEEEAQSDDVLLELPQQEVTNGIDTGLGPTVEE